MSTTFDSTGSVLPPNSLDDLFCFDVEITF